MGAIKTLADAAWVDGTPVNKANVRGVTDQIDTEVEGAKSRLTALEGTGGGVSASRQITGGGLATGGGTLEADRVITVTEATQAQAQVGTASNVVMTPRRTKDQIDARRATIAQVHAAENTDQLATPASLRGLLDRMLDRPGEMPARYTSSLTGSLLSSASIPASIAVTDSEGRVARIVGAGVIASASAFRIEPGHQYRVRFVVRRRVNSPDPANDSVRLAIRWLTSTKAGVSGAGGTQVIDDLDDLTTGDGRTIVSAIVATAAGDNIDFAAPAGTVYARPYVEQFGSATTQTDVEVIEWIDLTEAAAFSPDLTSLTNRVDTLESFDAGNRLDAVEALLSGAEIARFKTQTAAAAATIGATIDLIETLGHTADGDGGAALYKRVGSEPSHPGKFESADGAWWELATTRLLPEMFGDTSTDATAAFNDALEVIRSKLNANAIVGWYLEGNNREYRCDGSINGTGIQGHQWGIRNVYIDAHCTGKAVLDLGDSRFGTFSDITMWGDATDTPAIGLQQFRRASDSRPAANHAFRSVVCRGHYTLAALLNYASEVCLYEKCSFWNSRPADGGGESWAAIIQGSDVKTPVSDFQTPTTGNQPFNLARFDSCEFRKPGGTAAGDCVLVNRYTRITFDDCYFVTQAGYTPVTIYCVGIERHLKLRALFETETSHIVKITGDAAANRNIHGLEIETHVGNVNTNVFVIDTITQATIHNLKLAIQIWNSGPPSGGVFDDPSKYALWNYDIWLPTMAAMNDRSLFAGQPIHGTLQAADTRSVEMFGARTFPSNNTHSGNNTFSGSNNFTGARQTVSGFLSLGAEPTLTIAGGEVTAASSSFRVDTEGAAATDELDTINGGALDDILYIRSTANARRVIVTEMGNIRLNGGPFVLWHTHDSLLLIRGATDWRELSRSSAGRDPYTTISTNADVTLTPGFDGPRVRHTGTLTADRTVTLETANVGTGAWFKITRTGGGAFSLNIGTGSLIALATGGWCEVVYDGSVWYVAEAGSLP